MGIRNQRVEIGFSIKTLNRAVYAIKCNSKGKFQTGYVQYDGNEIPVWRPFDPNDMSMNALWRNSKWENIYVLRMSHKKDVGHVEYEDEDFDFEGKAISLPKVSTELMFSFVLYLQKQN